MNRDEAESREQRRARRVRLMVAMQRGETESCRELLDDIGPSLMNFLRRRIADHSELEDLYQETILAVYQARHTYDGSRPLEPWLFAIARNIATDHARRHWGRASWLELTEVLPERPAESESRDPDFEGLLSRLPPAQREAFEMLKLEGLSLDEAAARAGTTVGALKVRAHRAYKMLKALIAR